MPRQFTSINHNAIYFQVIYHTVKVAHCKNRDIERCKFFPKFNILDSLEKQCLISFLNCAIYENITAQHFLIG